MNNLKKIGVSALAGSLAMTAAHAVEYSMSGDAIIKYASIDSPKSGSQASNGKGFGVDTDLAFTASGETEQGWTVTFFQAANTNTAWSNSSSQVTIGMGSMGTVQFNNAIGSKANFVVKMQQYYKISRRKGYFNQNQRKQRYLSLIHKF